MLFGIEGHIGMNENMKVGMLKAKLNAIRTLRFRSSTSGASKVLRHASLQK